MLPIERDAPARLTSVIRGCLAIAMAWAAGFVDAVGWLLLAHVYTTHMTGNTAAMASEIARGQMQEAFQHAWPILVFVAGLLYGAAATAVARRHNFHGSFSVALVTELALLSTFVALGSAYGENIRPNAEPAVFHTMVSCLAAAMGMQTVTVTNVAGLRVYTTYLTGSLSKFAEAATQYALWFHDRTRGRFRRRILKVLAVTPRIKYVRHAAITAGLWTGFFLGAVCGAVSELRLGAKAGVFPLIVLTLAVGVDLWRPVAAADQPAAPESAH